MDLCLLGDACLVSDFSDARTSITFPANPGRVRSDVGTTCQVLREECVLVSAELRTDVVDVRDELALHLVHEVEEAVTIEVDPDEGAGDTALVAAERLFFRKIRRSVWYT